MGYVEKLESDLIVMIENIFKEFDDTRNNDRVLTWKIWEVYYGVNGVVTREQYISDVLPTQDNVKRIRARIQNELGKYPPTDWKVAKKRAWLEIDWRSAMAKFPPKEEPIQAEWKQDKIL